MRGLGGGEGSRFRLDTGEVGPRLSMGLPIMLSRDTRRARRVRLVTLVPSRSEEANFNSSEGERGGLGQLQASVRLFRSIEGEEEGAMVLHVLNRGNKVKKVKIWVRNVWGTSKRS